MSSEDLPTLFEKQIYKLSQITGIIAIIILIAMMLFTVLDVALRAFFNRPLPGDVEIIEVAMVCTGFLGLAWCAIKGMHIRVDLVVSLFSKRIRALIDTIGYLIALFVYCLMAWQGLQEGLANKQMNSLSSTLEFPIYPFYWIMSLGFAALCLSILALLMRSIREVIKK